MRQNIVSVYRSRWAVKSRLDIITREVIIDKQIITITFAKMKKLCA